MNSNVLEYTQATPWEYIIQLVNVLLLIGIIVAVIYFYFLGVKLCKKVRIALDIWISKNKI